MRIPSLLAAIAITLCAGPARAEARRAPATVFDLAGWKLQIPGPADVRDLKGYASEHFSLSADGEMRFHLDAAEKGATPNTKYVRAELRHLAEWTADETRTLSGEFRVVSTLSPDKVTVLQIHGLAADGGNAPPLLRVAVQSGSLVAVLKTDSEGTKNEAVTLEKQVGARYVKVEVAVKERRLTVAVDGQVRLTRSLAHWGFRNYFKAGCYPQATRGVAEVFFRTLSAE